MGEKLNVVTGATGMLGSHVAEQLRARNERVRALVRASSDVAFLRELGVELVVGDLSDGESIRRAVTGADVVYHCAAKVGDWGPWSLYQAQVIDATRNLLEACHTVGVGRLLHVSSVTVYGHPRTDAGPITETTPLGQNLWWWDYYCRSKIEAEGLARQYGKTVTVVRPSWIYGPRDRNTLPRLLETLAAERMRLLGRGDNLLNLVYAGDVAAGAILAANQPAAGGEAFNLCSEGNVTQQQFLDALSTAIGSPPVTRKLGLRLAYAIAFLLELFGRNLGLRRAPRVTRYAISLFARPTTFSIAKARQQLGWEPRIKAEEGVRRSLEWFRARTAAAVRPGAERLPV